LNLLIWIKHGSYRVATNHDTFRMVEKYFIGTSRVQGYTLRHLGDEYRSMQLVSLGIRANLGAYRR
jgi:hypothetical protein